MRAVKDFSPVFGTLAAFSPLLGPVPSSFSTTAIFLLLLRLEEDFENFFLVLLSVFSPMALLLVKFYFAHVRYESEHAVVLSLAVCDRKKLIFFLCIKGTMTSKKEKVFCRHFFGVPSERYGM